MATAAKNLELIKKFGKSATDSGSVSVQVAVLTERINELSSHFEKNTKDHSSKRGLLKMIGKRRSLLKYLNMRSETEYQKVITELGLRK
ncbi:MAG: 30S ribosomal protein S15 [Bacteriovoracaceae bacterium]|nr:30S ribosomal protein S15 [Bacteriovoracaceae bacterium]